MNGATDASRTGGGVCEHCGNRYDKAFTLVLGGESHVFDSFECAIHALAPRCAHCGCAIIGHGVEARRTYVLLRALCEAFRRARPGRSHRSPCVAGVVRTPAPRGTFHR